MKRLAWIALWLSALAPHPAHADTVQARCEIVPHGANRPSSVQACSFSQRQGFVSISRADGLRHELSPSQQPGAPASRYTDDDGSPAVRSTTLGTRGLVFRLPQETVRVFWSTAGIPTGPPRYQRTLKWQGLTFRIQGDSVGGRPQVTIKPSGLQRDNTALTRPVDGNIVGSELADLDADGSPELYIYLMGTGDKPAGSLLAIGVNRGRSLSDIAVPVPDPASQALKGWRGGDRYAVVENTLVRRFRVYRDDDRDGLPSGGWRQLQYKLQPGEASAQLKLDRVVDF